MAEWLKALAWKAGVWETQTVGSNPTSSAKFGTVAQLVEQQTFNLLVVGSIPTRPTTLLYFTIYFLTSIFF